ncbi:MAG: VWA domain-containing protein [Acidobacteriaceae bacterium]
MLGVLPVVLAMLMVGQQQSVPDAPAAQQTLPSSPAPQGLKGLIGSVAPGEGTSADSNGDSTSASSTAPAAEPQAATPPAVPPATQAVPGSTGSSIARPAYDQAPPEIPTPGQGPAFTLRTGVNFVEVPVTVEDKHGQLVAGLTYRDFKVYENNVRQQLAFFTVDPFPLSVALVIDQSVTQDTMRRVNDSLAALQGAFAPYDSVAIFTYNNGPVLRTAFTAAQGARVPAAIEALKTQGRQMGVPVNDGPMATPGIIINNQDFDHNQTMHPATAGGHLTIPKEVHTLNDAILEAAELTAGQPKGRRRIVYVISDGKEAGSKASYKEVVRYLQTHKIAVYGTLVGDSATWGIGFLDRFHMPFFLQENILPKYAAATGGQFASEYHRNGIEESFAKITEEVRNQYTLGYNSHEPMLDGKFRKIEVQVTRPGLTVLAKDGYYPSAQDAK